MEHTQSSGKFKEIAHGSSRSGPSISESVTRGKEAIGVAATDAMNSAGSDLQSLRTDLNNLKDTLVQASESLDSIIPGHPSKDALNRWLE
jgi:hypothetical protein